MAVFSPSSPSWGRGLWCLFPAGHRPNPHLACLPDLFLDVRAVREEREKTQEAGLREEREAWAGSADVPAGSHACAMHRRRHCPRARARWCLSIPSTGSPSSHTMMAPTLLPRAVPIPHATFPLFQTPLPSFLSQQTPPCKLRPFSLQEMGSQEEGWFVVLRNRAGGHHGQG